jgi:hypothetical protein
MGKSSVDWVKAQQKAVATDKWTEIIMRAIAKKVAKRWKFVSFRGSRGGEWRGIVDALAIRKDTSRPNKDRLKRGDLFDIMVIQMKGGSAKFPTPEEKERLKAVANYYRAKNVVLFEWKKGKKTQFYVLNKKKEWKEITASELFGT